MSKYLDEEVLKELAEKRTIETLRLSKEEVTIAIAYETTKAVELIEIKRELNERRKMHSPLLSFWWSLISKH